MCINGIRWSGPDSGEEPRPPSRLSLPGWNTTLGGSQETYPPGPEQGPEHANNWFSGFNSNLHLLSHKDVQLPYPDDTDMEGWCKCIPGTRCDGHWKLQNISEQEAETHQQHLIVRMASEDGCKYQYNWLANFRTLPPSQCLLELTPWHKGWDHMNNSFGFAAKKMVYRFFAYCMVYPNQSKGDFDMMSKVYFAVLGKLKHNTVGPAIYLWANLRPRRLELFINNPHWFDQSWGGRCIIHQVLAKVQKWDKEDPKLYKSFVRPRCTCEK